MKLLKILTLSMMTMAMPLSLQAICFVNTEAPGVHETTNPKTVDEQQR